MPARWVTPPGWNQGDGELVRRALVGDNAAFETLVRRHQTALFRYARGLGIPPDPAEDLLQEAYVRAYRLLATCQDPERFEVWIFRILRNAALDWLKDVRRRSVDVDVIPLRDRAPAPDELAARSELASHLDEGLAELPDDLRDAFLMKHLEGLSYDQMAEISGASHSALKMRVMRAREALRATLRARGIAVPM